jgi:hypothetical protein
MCPTKGADDVAGRDGGARPCLLCGDTNDPTVEHIIPQTLWKRFGIDPNRDELAVYRTTLCGRHQRATSVLHNDPEMMDLIESGEPVTRRTLQQLARWTTWVTLLLGLARGSAVLGGDLSRELLLRRFDGGGGGPPGGMRVYAARVSRFVQPAEPAIVPYLLALHGDDSVLLDSRRRPSGFSFAAGPMNASESIGIGSVALLAMGKSYVSGPDHESRLDQAVAQVGLERIHPLSASVPTLSPRPVSMTDVSRLFTVFPIRADLDLSLMPARLKALWGMEADEQ